MTSGPEASGPVPGPLGRLAPRPTPPPESDLAGAHPQVATALEDLTSDLSTLPLAEHHDRFVAVLDILQGMLDGARSRA